MQQQILSRTKFRKIPWDLWPQDLWQLVDELIRSAVESIPEVRSKEGFFSMQFVLELVAVISKLAPLAATDDEPKKRCKRIFEGKLDVMLPQDDVLWARGKVYWWDDVNHMFEQRFFACSRAISEITQNGIPDGAKMHLQARLSREVSQIKPGLQPFMEKFSTWQEWFKLAGLYSRYGLSGLTHFLEVLQSVESTDSRLYQHFYESFMLNSADWSEFLDVESLGFQGQLEWLRELRPDLRALWETLLGQHAEHMTYGAISLHSKVSPPLSPAFRYQ